MKKVVNLVINFLIVAVIISLYVFAYMYLYNIFRERKRKEVTNKIIERVDEIIEEVKVEQPNNEIAEVEVNYNNIIFTVLGKLYIEKFGLYEPILKENTKAALDTALVKAAGPDLNKNGNVVIAGHNYMKNAYFIKINKLVNNDKVTVTDLNGVSIDYYVYETSVVSMDDPSYLKQPENKDEKIITLVTCTLSGTERHVIKAKAR